MAKKRIKEFGQTGLTDTARFGPKNKKSSGESSNSTNNETDKLSKKTGE